MQNEVKINSRTAKVELLGREGTKYRARIDDREYEFDVVRVEPGIYSVLHNGKSTNMEMIEVGKANQYSVKTLSSQYDVEVIDALTRYRNNTKGDLAASGNVITTPMPGKVVRIPVTEGDVVEAGQTVITISAMKMESEYKSAFRGIVKKILVNEGDTIEGHQPLIELEPLED
jgi:biotin carboxyl carrier protein